ncbi:MAG: ATP-binding protein [Syntrophorhabdaceae bacterium]|nr:ATP-binding protein [Syntrophorhabdaceae bacterium]
MEKLAEITRPASKDSLPLLMDFVRDQIWNMEFTEERKKDICNAVEEALLNIFYYGKALENTEINITFKLDNFGRFLIIITDFGAPFNMLLREAFPDEEEAQKINAPPFSIKVMKRVIKDLEYKRIENMNILTFTIPRL